MTTSTTAANTNAIVNTMVHQLGGNRFMMMTGCKPQYKKTEKNGDVTVAFKIPRNSSKSNYFTVTYNQGMDLYTMEFVRMYNGDRTVQDTTSGLYGDMLQSVFTSHTELYTTL